MYQTELSTVLPPPLPPVRNGTYPSSGIMTTTAAEDPIKLWLKIGAIDKLEQAVLDGYGRQLLGKTSRIPKIHKFLQNVPLFQTKIDKIHDAVAHGDKEKLIEYLEHEKLALCRDHNGASPLHKAIMHGHKDMVKYLLQNHSAVLFSRDHQGRSPLHYAALIRDSDDIYDMLLDAGADTMAVDNRGRKASAYHRQPDINIESLAEQENRPKRIRPPRRLIMRTQVFDKKARERSARPVITKAGLRHFIKVGDKEKLEQVILYGYGNKLLGEGAHDSSMADFLDTVPTLLEKINGLHRSVVRGKLDEVIEVMETSEDSEMLLMARDQLGATPLHKAVMHGHANVAKYLVNRYPQSLGVRDREGRTALHYAAAVDKSLYKSLISAGADSSVYDIRGKQAEYYLQRPDEIDLHLLVQKANRLNAMYNATTTTRLRQWSPTRTLNGLITRSSTVGNSRNGTDTLKIDILKMRRSKSQEVMSRNKDIPKPRRINPLTNKTTSERKAFKRISKSFDKLDQQKRTTLGDQNSRGRTEKRRIPKVKETSWGSKMYKSDNVELTKANIRKWIHDGDLESLETVVLEGQGEKLTAEHARNKKVREFLNEIAPRIMQKMKRIDMAVYEGDVDEVRMCLDRKAFAFGKNYLGALPLHRAIVHEHHDVINYILETFPECIDATDNEGRTALHYAAVLKDGGQISNLLLQSGADPEIRDRNGLVAEDYKNRKELLDFTEFERKPPNVVTPTPVNTSLRKEHPSRRLSTTSRKSSLNLSRPSSNLEYITSVVKEGDVSKLEELLLDGHGKHLVGKSSWNENAKSFLKNVPKYLDELSEFKESVVAGNEDKVKTLLAENMKLGHARFDNGATAVHLAANHGHPHILSLLLENFSDSVHYKDINGCTPLHYAGKAKNDEVYRLLVDVGSDPKVQDLKGRTPEYYLRASSRERSHRRKQSVRSKSESNLSARDDRCSQKETEDEMIEGNEDGQDDKEESLTKETSEQGDDKEESLTKETSEQGDDKEESLTKETSEQGDDENNEDQTHEDAANGEQPRIGDDDELENEEKKDDSEEEDRKEEYLEEMIREWIATGNLQKLEHVIIAGQGDRLIGRTSSDEQIDEFLRLVPAYMAKIRKVHSAVVRGNMDEVQDRLNRKRFALSRDNYGASPLHLAILYEKPEVTQFIISTYPQIIDGPDNMGRTSLHYAASLSDGGAVYRTLLNAGADPERKDRLGNTAYDYLNNPGTLTQEQLLAAYKENAEDRRDPSVQMWERPPTDDIENALTPPSDEEEKEEENYETTEETSNSVGELNPEDYPILGTEDGKYLASVLGDVLIKGLTDVSTHRPPDPIGHLAHWLYQYASRSASENSHNLNDEDKQSNGNGIITTSEDNREVPEVYARNISTDINANIDVSNAKRIKDESGQTLLHFAASRSHTQDSFYALLSQAKELVAERDELYRTARDIASESGQEENVATIDRFIVGSILEKRLKYLEELIMNGYDKIFNITNNAGTDIDNILRRAGRQEMISILKDMSNFQKQREDLHMEIYHGNLKEVSKLLSDSSISQKLVLSKNYQGRNSAHVAILCDRPEILKLLLDTAPELVNETDNMGRYLMHYAMGSPSLEVLGKILVGAGAQREVRDVRRRSPSYNLIDNEEIKKLVDEQKELLEKT